MNVQVGAAATRLREVRQQDPCSHSYLHVLHELVIEWAETGKSWEFMAMVNHGICCLPRGHDKKWHKDMRKLHLYRSKIRRLCFLTPFPITTERIYIPVCHRSVMLKADFFTRQFIHSSLTRRKISKVTVVLQRREETGLKYSDYQRVSSLQTPRAQRFAPPRPSFSLATHNVSCARSPAGPSCWTLEPWRRTAIHSAVSHSAAVNPIMCNYSNARRETSIVYKTLKGNKPYNTGHLKWELRVTGKIQTQYLDLKKKKKINQ